MSNAETYAQLRTDTVAVNVIFNDPVLFSRREGGKVEIAFRSGGNTNPHTLQSYTYKALKSDNVVAGDVVLVTVNNGQIKVAQVLEVLDIQNISKVKSTKWILGRVDGERILRILEQEHAFVSALNNAKARQHQIETLQKMRDNYGDEVVAELAKMDGMSELKTLLEHKPE